MMTDDDFDSLFEEQAAPEGVGIFTTAFWGDTLHNRNAEVFAFLKEQATQTDDYIDEYGYTWLVIAFEINESENCCCWVEWKSKTDMRIEEHEYFLKARLADGGFLMWPIQTYNNYFGCTVLQLACSEQGVNLRYQDKHDTFHVFLGKDNKAIFRPLIDP